MLPSFGLNYRVLNAFPYPGASDATYHIMWIVLCNALDDFGIREVNDIVRTGTPETMLPQHAQIEEKKRKVGESSARPSVPEQAQGSS